MWTCHDSNKHSKLNATLLFYESILVMPNKIYNKSSFEAFKDTVLTSSVSILRSDKLFRIFHYSMKEKMFKIFFVCYENLLSNFSTHNISFLWRLFGKNYSKFRMFNVVQIFHFNFRVLFFIFMLNKHHILYVILTHLSTSFLK